MNDQEAFVRLAQTFERLLKAHSETLHSRRVQHLGKMRQVLRLQGAKLESVGITKINNGWGSDES